MRVDASLRAALNRLLPGVPWHQALAVVTTVWLLFMAAFALAMAQVTGNGDAVANARQVVVRGGAIPAAAPGGGAVDQGGDTSWNPADDGSDTGGGDDLAPLTEDPLAGSGFLPSVPLPAAEPAPADEGDGADGGSDLPEATTWPAGQEAYTVLIGGSRRRPRRRPGSTRRSPSGSRRGSSRRSASRAS